MKKTDEMVSNLRRVAVVQSCTSPTQQLYLNVKSDTMYLAVIYDRKDNFISAVFCPVSKSSMQSYLRKKIPLSVLVKMNDRGYSYRRIFDVDNERSEWTECKGYPKEFEPSSDFFDEILCDELPYIRRVLRTSYKKIHNGAI